MRAQRLKQAMAETLVMVQDKGGAMARAVGQRLRMTAQARSILPELEPSLARMVALYGRRIRAGEVPLADAVAKFAAHDRSNGKQGRAAEWANRLASAAKAPVPAIEVQQHQQKMAPRMRLER